MADAARNIPRLLAVNYVFGPLPKATDVQQSRSVGRQVYSHRIQNPGSNHLEFATFLMFLRTQLLP